MKITYRIPHPTDQYAFVELIEECIDEEAEVRSQPEYIRKVYDNLTAAFKERKGVGIKKLAEIIHEYCKTGSIADGGGYEFSSNESLLLNELKKIVRKTK